MDEADDFEYINGDKLWIKFGAWKKMDEKTSFLEEKNIAR